MTQDHRLADPFDIQGGGGPENRGGQRHYVPDPVVFRQRGGLDPEHHPQASERQDQTSRFYGTQPVLVHDEMGPQRHPERVGIQKNGGPGSGGKRHAPVQKQKIHPKQQADHHGMVPGAPGKKNGMTLESRPGKHQKTSGRRPDRRCQKRWNPLVAELDADRIAAPDRTDQHEQETGGQRNVSIVQSFLQGHACYLLNQ